MGSKAEWKQNLSAADPVAALFNRTLKSLCSVGLDIVTRHMKDVEGKISTCNKKYKLNNTSKLKCARKPIPVMVGTNI